MAEKKKRKATPKKKAVQVKSKPDAPVVQREQVMLTVLNQAQTPEELRGLLKLPRSRASQAEAIWHARSLSGGVFRSTAQLIETTGIGLAEFGKIIDDVIKDPVFVPKPPTVRSNFRALLAKNANYFGNLEKSKLKPVKIMVSNKAYEDLACVGLSPPYDRLEAIVRVHLNNGYGGDVCSAGSREYVRFYVDLYDDGTWHDVGVTNVQVFDIAGFKPLCYAVYLDFNPAVKFCFSENIVKVRAILSWNVAPPANTPNYMPVWGERQDTEVVIRPRTFILVKDLFEALEPQEFELPDPIGPVLSALDPMTKIAPIPKAPITVAMKKELYKGAKVPVHRFAFPEAMQLISQQTSGEMLFDSSASELVFQGLKQAEIASIIDKIVITPVDGDTSFEELSCIGLRPQLPVLEGVIRVKKNSGYSGSLCSDGSTEYVAFWADFQDGMGYTYLGTATVPVHDLSTIPANGVDYAVFLPVDLSKHQIPCQIGPRVVRLRAILSWETPPPPANPDWVPTWGNREECRIHIYPGELVGHIPLIESVGDIGVDDIDQANGLATGSGIITGISANQSPFGGQVAITGRIGDPPDSFGGGQASFKYKVEVSPDGVNDWHPLTNNVGVKITEWFAGIPQQCDVGEWVCDQTLVANDDLDGLGDGWYEYLEDFKGLSQRFLVQDVLARWVTDASMEGLWKIRITAKDPATGLVFPGLQTIKVRLDNTRPSAPPPDPGDPNAAIRLEITGATFNGAVIEAEDCGKFPVGSIIEGEYEVHDPGITSPNQHFGAFSLDVIPDGPAAGAATVPSGKTFPAVSTNGELGTWTLDTAGMEACGYTVRLLVHDRTIAGCSYGRWDDEYVGFCLVEPEA